MPAVAPTKEQTVHNMMLGLKRRCIFLLLVTMVFIISDTHGQASRYLGCYFDFTPNRVLPNLTKCDDVTWFCNNHCNTNFPYCQSTANMSVTACLGLCAGKELAYAGLEAGTQCFCGGRTARYDQYGEVRNASTCVSSCSGDSTQNCGSDFRIRIFEIGCLPFEIPPNSTLSPASENFYEISRTVNVSCQDGFYPNGPRNLMCLHTGQWNLPPPSCLPDVCEAPEPPNGTRAAERPTNGSESLEYRGGDTVAFACVDTNATVNVSCVEGEWVTDGLCPEVQQTTETIVTSTASKTSQVEVTLRSDTTTLMATDRPTQTETLSPELTEAVQTEETSSLSTGAVQTDTVSSLLTEETTEQNLTNVPMFTNAEEFTASSQATMTRGVFASTPWGSGTTSTPPARSPREPPISMLWLIIIVGAALFLFAVVLLVAILMVCRKKAKRGEPIIFQGNSLPRIEDMSQVNQAYENEEMVSSNQNGRPTSGSPIRISTLYSQQEITVENNNGTVHEYAKPVTPAYTPSQSAGTLPNEYSSPVRHSNGDTYTQRSPSVYFADIPEPDYDNARRESYVEMVTKL